MIKPIMPTGYWNGERLSLMWYYVKWFIGEYQVFIMIGTGIAIAFTLLSIIVNLFIKEDKDEDEYDYREI